MADIDWKMEAEKAAAALMYAVEPKIDAPGESRTHRCGHNFPPSQCPYIDCGYRSALKSILALAAIIERGQRESADTALLDWWKLHPRALWIGTFLGQIRVQSIDKVFDDPREAIRAAMEQEKGRGSAYALMLVFLLCM